MGHLRITGGEARGRLIAGPTSSNVRPTASKIRQALFNILGNSVNNCHFLDLFAGSGLIGMEALSRGAATLTSVEENHKMVKSIQANLTKLGYNADVICGEVQKVIPTLKPHFFDIIYADPPYQSPVINSLLTIVGEYQLLNPKGQLIIEHMKGIEPLENTIEEKRRLIHKDKRIYGQTVISFFVVNDH